MNGGTFQCTVATCCATFSGPVRHTLAGYPCCSQRCADTLRASATVARAIAQRAPLLVHRELTGQLEFQRRALDDVRGSLAQALAIIDNLRSRV